MIGIMKNIILAFGQAILYLYHLAVNKGQRQPVVRSLSKPCLEIVIVSKKDRMWYECSRVCVMKEAISGRNRSVSRIARNSSRDLFTCMHLKEAIAPCGNR